MEAKINIAEILESKSQGTKLYSLTYGDCFYQEYTGDFGIECQNQNGVQFNLDEYGKYCIDGECIIFPSKEMRDWRKFFKKGDVLVNKDRDVHVIFERFADDTYCSFVGKYYLWKENNDTEQFCKNERLLTSDFQKAGKDAAQTYLKTIEKRLGGKLNRETLEVEKAQPEFKDGDIVVYGKSVAICRKIYKHTLCFYVSLNEMFGLLFDDEVESSEEYRFATEEEKKQFFSALEKEGKRWDSDKKAIVDLKPKVELKPFDKVLVRDFGSQAWQVSLFGYKDSDFYYCCNGCGWNQCIPYNEETAHLLGTTGEWKGGEG
jgi:hypothetical protein